MFRFFQSSLGSEKQVGNIPLGCVWNFRFLYPSRMGLGRVHLPLQPPLALQSLAAAQAAPTFCALAETTPAECSFSQSTSLRVYRLWIDLFSQFFGLGRLISATKWILLGKKWFGRFQRPKLRFAARFRATNIPNHFGLGVE